MAGISLSSDVVSPAPSTTRAGAPAAAVEEPTAELTQVPSTETFVAFYRARRDPVARALALTLADGHLGAEATDEAMARAFQRWAKVGSFDDPAGWVYRVGLNWATSVLRRRRRAPQPHAERGAVDVGPVAEPAVLDALAALDVRQRSVVVCRYYLGLSEQETAAALNTRPGTVKSRLHRGLRNLQTDLEHLRPEETR